MPKTSVLYKRRQLHGLGEAKTL